MMKKHISAGTVYRSFALFVTSGSLYVAAELLYRRRSHFSMFVAAGVCVMIITLLCRCCKTVKRRGIVFQALTGGAVITAVELIFGLIVNVALGMDVWDYTAMPLNFLGQICVPFSLLWAILSVPAIYLGKLFFLYETE